MVGSLRHALSGVVIMCALSLPATGQAQGIAGPYLAAVQADVRNDYEIASGFYNRVLAINPGNTTVLQSALITGIIADRVPLSMHLAERLDEVRDGNQVAGLALLAKAFSENDYDRAMAIAGTPEYRFNPLFAQLSAGWAAVGRGDYAAATTVFDNMTGNSALEVYGQFHKALALALAGDFATAAEILDGDDEGPLHLSRLGLLAHVASLSQAERGDDALEVLEATMGADESDQQLVAMRAALQAGETVPFDQISGAGDGAAAVFSLMASALTREDAERFGLVYGRLANYLNPGDDDTRAMVADTLARQGQFDLAIAAYGEIGPDSPWYLEAEIGRADALRFDDRVDQAVEVLERLTRDYPENLRVHTALGDTLRNEERYAEAADVYDRAVELAVQSDFETWFLYYARGITKERTQRWPEAEADFRKALELEPDQPLVLNYLGYSLVEMRLKLDEAQQMIEKAVEQRPEDGYITDSLGWVLYTLGKYEEAVAPMERAVELVPVDPIINDHLGDVFWKVDRKLEAEFQWRRALSFEPEEKDAARIRRKLDVGLDVVLEEESQAGDDVVPTAQGD